MATEINYPVQMGDIRPNHWRLRNGNLLDLYKKEVLLWNKLSEMAEKGGSPERKLSSIPGSHLIGYGWEWKVFGLENNPEIAIKIPRGIFPEVNREEYLDNTKYAYEICKKYFSSFVVNSKFERKNIEGIDINFIYQDRIYGHEVGGFLIKNLSGELKNALKLLSDSVLNILSEYQWMPDLGLRKINNSWRVRNILLNKDEELKIVDFTAYYDVFRLYKLRMWEEVVVKSNNWKNFSKELKK